MHRCDPMALREADHGASAVPLFCSTRDMPRLMGTIIMQDRPDIEAVPWDLIQELLKEATGPDALASAQARAGNRLAAWMLGSTATPATACMCFPVGSCGTSLPPLAVCCLDPSIFAGPSGCPSLQPQARNERA